MLNITPLDVPVLGYGFTPAAPPATTTHTFLLRWLSEPWTTYRIEQSVNLLTWTLVDSCTASEGTSTDVDITGSPTSRTRLFFRVKRE